MGREFPENASEDNPFISISLFIACIAATISVVSSLCGGLSRKKEPSSSPVAVSEMKDQNVDVINVSSPNDHPPHDNQNHGSPPKGTSDAGNAMQNEELLQQPLPPPPGMQRLSGAGAASYHCRSNSTTSSLRKLSSTLSTIGMSSRQSSKRDQENHYNSILNNGDYKKKDKKLKHEDSIWKKTIILGEKCKVPDEDDDAILYDENGNRISTFHRKSTSVALSRQSSNVDADAIPSHEGHQDEILRHS